jgi:hypothetical protein
MTNHDLEADQEMEGLHAQSLHKVLDCGCHEILDQSKTSLRRDLRGKQHRDRRGKLDLDINHQPSPWQTTIHSRHGRSHLWDHLSPLIPCPEINRRPSLRHTIIHSRHSLSRPWYHLSPLALLRPDKRLPQDCHLDLRTTPRGLERTLGACAQA